MKELADKKALQNLFKILLTHKDLEHNITNKINIEFDKYVV